MGGVFPRVNSDLMVILLLLGLVAMACSDLDGCTMHSWPILGVRRYLYFDQSFSINVIIDDQQAGAELYHTQQS